MEINNKIKRYFSEIFSILDKSFSISKMLMTDDFGRNDLYDWLDREVYKEESWDWSDGLKCDDIEFYFSAGETKMVIIINDYRTQISEKFDKNFVIKIPFENTCHDYCKMEEVFSSILVDEYPDIKDLFALCYFLFNRYDKNIYIMERAETQDINEKGASLLIEWDRRRYMQKGYGEKEIEIIISSNYGHYYSDGEDTAKEIIRVSYSEEIFSLLGEFLSTFNINDIHQGNIGFINNNPVIIDYSGYHESSSSYSSSSSSSPIFSDYII